ncbi:unnamed protein product [Meloidogyne enterolobii]|uniref:Uncharacterized protein n=1 Tax=Meloidogyne enterolobii TaxID=390850 RepID=A0ACB1A895_MELEN
MCSLFPNLAKPGKTLTIWMSGLAADKLLIILSTFSFLAKPPRCITVSVIPSFTPSS